MTKSIKRRPDKSALYLLDDGRAPDFTQLGAEVHSSKARPRADTSSRAILLGKRSNRIFRSEQSLRQMMSEYNRHAPRSGPLKPSAPEPAKQPASSDDFTFESIRQINLAAPEAGITGKILRPKC